MSFNVNNHEVIKLTNTLDKIHRSAIPVSVRGALNSAAFDMKKNSLGREFNNNFTLRRPTFLSSHTRFNKSTNTFDINKMESSAGVIKGKSLAGDQLELQEKGGSISDRSIPTLETRGGDKASKQKAMFWFRKFQDKPLGHFPNQKGKRIKRRSKKTFLKTKQAVFQIDKGGEFKPLYFLNKNPRIDKRPFVKPAGETSAKLIAGFYVKQAERRIKKAFG